MLLNNVEVIHLKVREFSFKLVDLSGIHCSKEFFEGIPYFLHTLLILGMINKIILNIRVIHPRAMSFFKHMRS
jgi:hypothetical protein